MNKMHIPLSPKAFRATPEIFLEAHKAVFKFFKGFILKYIVKILFVLLMSSLVTSCQVLLRRNYVGKNDIDQFLKRCIGDSLYSATINRKIPKRERNVTCKKEAVRVIEPILFEKYGEERIINQKPYEIHLVNGFWVIKGTILKKDVGGTFSVVIDSGSGNIEKIFYSK